MRNPAGVLRGGVMAAAVTTAALALAGCEATVAPQPADPQYCPKVYQPVCARRGAERKTFPNACVASTEGYDAFSPGACEQPKPDRICPQIYQPVCAVRAGQYSTYSNDCVAGAEGARVVKPGPC